ncbi:hypothetical protein JTS96_03965 [Clostridium botulinum]|nr:hypothetical protein [Clostridium botulinum]
MKYALTKRVACINDSDPQKLLRKRRGQDKTLEKCWPFEIDLDTEHYDYKAFSGTIKNLLEDVKECKNVNVFYNITEKGKTLEYDIALENYDSDDFFNDKIEIMDFQELNKSSWKKKRK